MPYKIIKVTNTNYEENSSLMSYWKESQIEEVCGKLFSKGK